MQEEVPVGEADGLGGPEGGAGGGATSRTRGLTMEGALVSAAMGALKPVLGKLASLMGSEYKRLKGIRKEIESITRELVAMEAFLFKMSEVENHDVQDKAWMNEVRELSYDIEDNLDDFMVRVADKSAKPNGFMDKIKNLLARTKAHRQIAKAIEDLKKQVNEVSERRARYRTDDIISSAKNVTIDHRALAIFEDVSNLVGIDGPKDELLHLLTQETSRPQQTRMISIVGFGGLGKTTLANQVYQEHKGQFDCHAFVSVSRNPDMLKVLRTILSQAKGYPSSIEDIPTLIIEISSFLANKRYFIVVDDIWNADIWNVIKYAFPLSNCDSRIITTTRVNDVAQSCCLSFNGHIYNMEPLGMVHSRQLLHRRLFNSKECPSHLEEVSDQILKKCDGLPLAIIAISGLLANKAETMEQWQHVESSIGRGLERNSSVEGMLKIISLSYFDLPHHLKTCLLYLSIFPEDHVIEKNMLIRRWIAEGFIHKKDRYTIYEVAELCFNELINRSLIQPDLSDHLNDLTFEDEVKYCRVHDTILDFIVSKSIEDNFVTILGVPGINSDRQNKVRRLSLQNNSEIPEGLVLSNVRSLSVFGQDVKIPPLLDFKYLRVLCSEDYGQLEDHHFTDICNLLHLKCMRLKDVRIRKIPEQISKLQYLETLEIYARNHCTPTEIPATISQLGRLVHLHVYGCTMPGAISGMQALQALEGIRASIQSTMFARQLGELTNLRKLEIYFYNVVEEIVSSICKLLREGNLHSLHITLEMGADKFFKSLPAQCRLQELVIKGYSSFSMRLLSSFVNLQKLSIEIYQIYGPSVGQEDADILGDLPNLRSLSVRCQKQYVETAIIRAIEAHPNHPMFKMFDPSEVDE